MSRTATDDRLASLRIARLPMTLRSFWSGPVIGSHGGRWAVYETIARGLAAIDTLLAEELAVRESRRVRIALTMARLTPIKTLAGFDFTFQPSLDRERILALAELGFVEWGEVFGDPVVATALLDRLLHHAVVIQIEGASYRLRHHAELLPEHIRSKAIIASPIAPHPKRRGRPPKNHYDPAFTNPPTPR